MLRTSRRPPRGQSRVGEQAHGRLGVVELHEVKLDVLARGDVAEAA
jgi:hypothetical protein